MSREWIPRKQNLLMYLESRLVDNEGEFDHRHINQEEVEWIEEWCSLGLVDFSLMGGWVRFTDAAWKMAHRFRRERSERILRRKMEE